MSRTFIVVCLALAAAGCDQPFMPSSPATPSSPPAPAAAPEIIRIQVGESVRVTVGHEDFVPLDQYGDAYWLRLVRVATSEPVRAELRVIADNNDLVMWNIRNYTCCTRTSNVINIPANTELEVEVRLYAGHISPDNPTFTLITSRLP